MMAITRLRTLEQLLARSLERVRTFTNSAVTLQALEDLEAVTEEKNVLQPARKTSKAMIAYMDRARKHEEFMQKQISEFEIGRRHLANMMGEDPESFTQEDIDRAIGYLFPTGIFDKKARPLMRHPSEVFPRQKEAQFDETGRPHHSLFFTLKPNFYQTLFDVVEKLDKLNRLESRNLARGQLPDPTQKLLLQGSEWVRVEELSKMLVEPLRETEYQEFVRAMNRLTEHPLAYHEKEFLFKYRRYLQLKKDTDAVPELMFDAEGRPYMEGEGFRKRHTVARAVVRGRGSGQVTINGTPLVHYFCCSGARTGNQEVAQVMFPLQLTGLLDSVDVEASVQYRGPRQPGAVQAPTCQAGAVRLAVSMALRSFVDKDMLETMRIAGLLTRDVRERERYKPGKRGAREGLTWKKR